MFACAPYNVLFRHFKVRWIVEESPVYHRVEGSLLYQNPLSVNSKNLPLFPLYYYLFKFQKFTKKKKLIKENNISLDDYTT